MCKPNELGTYQQFYIYLWVQNVFKKMNMKKILLIMLCMFTSLAVAQSTYTSSQNGYWHNASTWGGGGVPGANDTAIIDGETVIIQNDAGSGADVTIDRLSFSSGTLRLRNDLTLTNSSGNSSTSSGTTLIVESGTLTVSDGNFTNAGTISVGAGMKFIFTSGTGDTFTNTGTVDLASTSQAFASLMFNGTYSGNVNNMQYSRFVEGHDSGNGAWDLIGPPLNGMGIATFISSNADLADNPSNDDFGIGPFSNTSGWSTYATSDVDFDNFSVGTGYQMATTSGSNVEFKGTVATSNVNVTIVSNETDPWGSGNPNRFNLVANPYPAYINANSNAGSDNVITQNLSALHEGVHQAIWYWDGAANSGTGAYSTITNATATKYVAPGQAFMVGAKGDTGDSNTFTFTAAMQNSSGSGDDFYAGDIMDEDRGELFITLQQQNKIKETEIYFIDEGSDGIDSSYDGALIDLADSTFQIFSRILNEEDNGTKISVNALSYSEMWDKVIPIGINALGGEEMTIGISHRTTPADLNIYLEDAQQATMTNLLDGDYVLTPTSDLSGVGRFFIHMTADTMSNEDVSTSMLNAYKEIDASYITIEGLATQTNETNVSLYNILGREVLSTTLNNNMNTQTISTVGLSTGIYVIELESGTDRLTKKLLIQ